MDFKKSVLIYTQRVFLDYIGTKIVQSTSEINKFNKDNYPTYTEIKIKFGNITLQGSCKSWLVWDKGMHFYPYYSNAVLKKVIRESHREE